MTEQRNSTYVRLLKFFSRRPMHISRFVARILAGIVNFLHVTKTSQTIRLNIEICLPELNERQRELVTRAAIRNELQSYMEFFSVWGSDNEKNIAQIHNVEGQQYFFDALAAQKGIVLIAPHFGTWEIMNAWFAQYTQMTILYKPIKNEEADVFVRTARTREKAHLVPTDETGVRQIFKALKQGGTTVILPDHTPHLGGEMVSYFGVPLASSNLSSKLIQKTKSKALLVYAIRNALGGFDMHIEPISDDIYQGTPMHGTQVLHQTIEHLIQRFPEHYHWSYKRFSQRANLKLSGLYKMPKAQALNIIDELRAENTDLIQNTETKTQTKD